MKDKLFNKHLEAINYNVHDEYDSRKAMAAKASVEITLGYMKEFAEWADGEGYRRHRLIGDGEVIYWMNFKEGRYTTEELLQIFLTSKK